MTASRTAFPRPAAADAATNGPAPSFGPNVKAIRLRRGLTLERLADETGLSKSHLSRFERGEKTLSVAALIRVSQALGTSAAALLGQSSDVAAAFHLVRGAARRARSVADLDGAYSYSALARGGGGVQLNAFVVDLPPEASRTSEVAHGGEEVLFVLSGRIEVELSGERLVLDEGDYLQFSGAIRHRIRSLAGTGRVLVVVAGG